MSACGGAKVKSTPDPAQPREGEGGSARRIDPPAARGASSVNLSPGADGSPLITWIEPAPDGGRRLRFARQTSAGWSRPVTIASGPNLLAGAVNVPAIAEAPGGALVAHYIEGAPAGHAQSVMLARSPDRGASWKQLGPAHDDGTATEHGFASLVADGDRVLAFWLDGRATANGGPTSLRAVAVGDAVTDPLVLDDRVCDCCPTAAAMTDDGPVMVYRDRSEDEVRDISIVRRVGKAWSLPAPVARDGWRIEGCPVSGPAVAAHGRQLAIAWHTEASEVARVKVAMSSDGGASFAPSVEIDSAHAGRVPIGRVGVALDASATALVSWVVRRGEVAELLIRRVSPDGQLGAERVVARTGAGRASGIPRMLRAGDDLILAWRDANEPELRAMALPPREIASLANAPAGARSRSRRPVGTTRGSRAPAYQAALADGSAVSLDSLAGKVVLINLWATWCAPCKEEMPHLAAFHRQLASRGLEVVAVSVDDARARDRALEYVAANRFPFRVWLDPDERAITAFSASSLPITLVIDRRGVIVFRRDGVITASDPELTSALEAALAAR